MREERSESQLVKRSPRGWRLRHTESFSFEDPPCPQLPIPIFAGTALSRRRGRGVEHGRESRQNGWEVERQFP